MGEVHVGGEVHGQRAFSLLEVLITIGIMAIMTTAATLGVGALSNARLKRSAVMVAATVRLAYAHASASGKATRVVFDFDSKTLQIEESSKLLKLEKGSISGGAAAATELEKQLQADAERFSRGPAKSQPTFSVAKVMGFEGDTESGRSLADKTKILRVEVVSLDEPMDAARAYLHFWPGGRAQQAAIQVSADTEAPEDSEVMTVLVHPLTGRTEILRGRVDLKRPETDDEASERSEWDG